MTEQVFRLPDLGEGLTEAELVRWLVAAGDEVAVDQPIAEVETAKAAVELPCPYAGMVATLHASPGETIEVDAPVITITAPTPASSGPPPLSGATDDAAEGKPVAQRQVPAQAAGTRADAAPTVTVAHEPGVAVPDAASDRDAANVLVGFGPRERPARSRAERRRRMLGSATTGGAPAGTARSVTGATPRDAAGRAAGAAEEAGPADAGPGESSPADGVLRGSALPAVTGGTRTGGRTPVISPLVRRLAREHGVDVDAVHGSGPDGLVLRRDVNAAIGSPTPASTGHLIAAPGQAGHVASPDAPSPGTGVSPEEMGGARRIPLRGVRGRMAEAMARSRREIPEATVWVDVDATEFLAVRDAINAADPDRPVSLLGLLARFCVLGLRRYPELNARVDADRREVVLDPRVHLGFAAQTDRGLMVPVAHDAHTRTARELSTELTRLTRRARDGALTPVELTGGTFTVNNYGVFGVDGSAAIINHPEVAIVGMGRIVDRPWAVGGELAVRKVTELTLAFDHRACDGGTAGGFLRYVADCVEHPATLIADL